MKKIYKAFFAVACIVIFCVAFSACSLFRVPQVKGCKYLYDKADCDTSLLSASDRAAVNSQLSGYVSNISTLAFSEEGTVEITSISGGTTVYDYLQVGTDVIIPDGPNINTKYQGDMVLGFTVTNKSNKVLKWHITLIPYNAAAVDIVLYYNILSDE